jgi:hypothetical protein
LCFDRSLAAYAQRTFASHETVLQAGQVNLYNPVLAGAQITGVQLMTEQALQRLKAKAIPSKGLPAARPRSKYARTVR